MPDMFAIAGATCSAEGARASRIRTVSVRVQAGEFTVYQGADQAAARRAHPWRRAHLGPV